MKSKKIIIIIFIAIALLLIGAGTVYSLYTKEPDQKEETKKPNKEGNDSQNNVIAELKTIKTPDNKIRIGSTKVYECNGITGMMLNVIPYEDFDKVYLKLTLNLSKSKEEKIVGLENLKKKEQINHEVQTLNDWSTLKSWSVEIITEQEAIALGYVKASQ